MSTPTIVMVHKTNRHWYIASVQIYQFVFVSPHVDGVK